MKNRFTLYLPVVVIGLAFAAGGCIFQPEDSPNNGGGGGGDTGLPFPSTPDQLIDNYKTVYQDKDIALYRDQVLSHDYKFVLQQGTVDEFGLPDNVYNYEEDVALQSRMFSEQPGHEANGTTVVISSIDIPIMNGYDNWEPVSDSDTNFGGYPNARKRTYDVGIYFHVSGESRQLYVAGQTTFYVTARDSTYQGAPTLYYQLLGQEDHTDS